MATRYVVSLMVERYPDKPEYPEPVGDPVAIHEFRTKSSAALFVQFVEQSATLCEVFRCDSAAEAETD